MIDLIKKLVLIDTRPLFVIDELKSKFNSITTFFDIIENPLTNNIDFLRDNDVPSSLFYNNFLTSIETDINLIHEIHNQIYNNMLASWNSVETLLEIKKEENIYDDTFLTEYKIANVKNNIIIPNIIEYIDNIPKIKDKPILKGISSNKKVDVFYGKAWGCYVQGNESGEDGIRYSNNDGGLIIDGKDTFWECEAVVLQEERENTKFFQPIINEDISLSVTIKIIFKEPVDINSFTIRPYNTATNSYYKLIKMDVSDGEKVYNIPIKETMIINETEFIFDIPINVPQQKITGLFLTLKQDSGYFMKYSLAKFKLKGNESWVDVTGPHVTEMAKKLGENFNENVTSVMSNIHEWIIHYWIPGTSYTEFPKLVTEIGNNGFITIPSSESDRKRYSIAITDIKIGKYNFSDKSEKITMPIEIPENTTYISILSEDVGNVFYFLSFDEGLSWKKIIPINKANVQNEDLKFVPKKIYINSDLSYQRIKNSDSGEEGFIFTGSKNVRIKFILEKSMDNPIIPKVYYWEIIWGKK